MYRHVQDRTQGYLLAQIGQALEEEPLQAAVCSIALLSLQRLLAWKPDGVGKHASSFVRPLYRMLLVQGKVRANPSRAPEVDVHCMPVMTCTGSPSKSLDTRCTRRLGYVC